MRISTQAKAPQFAGIRLDRGGGAAYRLGGTGEGLISLRPESDQKQKSPRTEIRGLLDNSW